MGQPSLETWIQLCVWGAILLGLIIVATLVVQRFRGGAAETGSVAGELLTNFQEMRSRGDISDADYRKIKSVLGDRAPGRAKGRQRQRLEQTAAVAAVTSAADGSAGREGLSRRAACVAARLAVWPGRRAAPKCVRKTITLDD